jgi:hypothetical protein
MTKLLFDDATGRVIGCGIVGTSAGDLIGEAALPIGMGADTADIGLTIHRHPTLSETWQRRRRRSREQSPICTCRNGDSSRHGVVQPAREQEQDSMTGMLTAGIRQSYRQALPAGPGLHRWQVPG